MGVIYVQEENPWAEFVQGLSPMATAWGDRYLERHRGKLLGEINDYGAAKPQFMKMEDLPKTTNIYQPAKAEMFSDNEFTDYSQATFNSKVQEPNTNSIPDFSQMKLNESRTPETRFSYPATQPFVPEFLPLSNQGQINTQRVKTLEDAKAESRKQVLSAQSTNEILNQRNAQIQAEFDMAQAQKRKDLIRRGASLFGSEYTNAVLNQQDQRRAFQNLKYDINTPVEEFYQIMGNTYLKNGDPQSAFNYFQAADEIRLKNRWLDGK